MPQVFEGNRHEAAHEQIRKSEIDVEDSRQRLLERYSPEEIDAIIQLYSSAYGDSGLTAEEVLEEIICDSLGKNERLCNGSNGAGRR